MLSLKISDIANSGIASYFKSISQKFCPFMKPADDAGVLRYSFFSVQGSFVEVERRIFAIGFVLTERFRWQRQNASKTSERALMCENPIFEFQDTIENEQAVLAWPHWLLKLMYLEAGVMYGKFWKGEKENDRRGIPIPEPVCTFMSIRSAVKAKDVRFFEEQLEFVPTLEQSFDDGQDCLAKLALSQELRSGTQRVVDDIRSHDPAQISREQVEAWVEAIYQSQLFEAARDWANLAHPV